MGLFERLTLVFLATTCSVQAAFVNLQATVVYDSISSCKGTSTGVPLQVTALAMSSCAESAECVESPTGSSLYPATVCSVTDGTSNGDFLTTTLPYLFGSSPYVVVETYAAAKSCSTAELMTVTAYLADGKCYKASMMGSYKATRKADGSATVQTYTDVECGAGSTTLTVTAAQAMGNSCTESATGVLDRKVYGAGTTYLDSSLYLSSTMIYDTPTDSCKPPGVPTQVATTVVAANTCTATSACAGSAAPFTGVSCSSTLTYKDEIAATFGSNAYVIVEKYTAGSSCDATTLSGIMAYLADGFCHKTGVSSSYLATRGVSGDVVVKTYTDSSCAPTTTMSTFSVTATQATVNSCTAGADGILDTKVFGSGRSLYLTQIQSYDTNIDNCKSPGRAIYVKTDSVAYYPGGCTATTTCSNSMAPFTGTTCGSPYSFKMDVAATFGTNPYVIEEVYIAGTNCDSTQLAGMTAYLADGQCHKSGAANSYVATRAIDGSATVKLYWNADCSGTSAPLDVSATQAKDNSCTPGPTGIENKKIYGAGATPMYMQSQLGFDTSTGGCVSPVVPTSVYTTIPSTTCTATAACGTTTDPYTSISCGTYSTFQADVLKMFGVQPYVIVESYTAGKSCDGTKLSGIVAYLADGKCHKMGTVSYIATRAADGSASIKTYATSATCSGSVVLQDVTAAKAKGQSCKADDYGILDKKIYGAGATPVYMQSQLGFDTSTGRCVSPVVPTSVYTTIPSTTCTATAACGTTTDPYTSISCGTYSTFQADVSKMFGTQPYVIVETYTGTGCDGTKILSMLSYLADGKCHKPISGLNYIATRAADGSAIVKTYTNADCTSGATPLVDATASQVKLNTCASNKKYYGGGVTSVSLSLGLVFDSSSGGCVSPVVPTSVTATFALTSCAPTSTCSGTADPYMGTSCGTYLTFHTDAPKWFRSQPYVIVESYTVGKNCDGTKFASMTAYLADGMCHKMGTAVSYIATRAISGSASIKTYQTADCSGTTTLLDVTVSQAKSNSCTAGTTGILDKKIYGAGETTLYLSSMLMFDTNTSDCLPPAIPTSVMTKVAASSTECKATPACTGSSWPFTRTTCSSTLKFKKDMTATFGVNPYVVVERYNPGQACAVTELSDITTYLADGKCRRRGTMRYKAVRRVDGSATIQTYYDGMCSGTPTTMDVSAIQAADACIKDTNGNSDTKIYGSGETPLYLKSVVNYEASEGDCRSPAVPTQVLTTTTTADNCVTTTGCTGSAVPYVGYACSTTSTYKTDMAKMFGANPFIIVERYYSGKSCGAGDLVSITTFLADDTCHTTGNAASYKAVRKTDGGISIIMFTNSASCDTTGATLDMTASQVTGNKCATGPYGVVDTKVYSAVEQYLSTTAIYDTKKNNCKLPAVPTQLFSTVVGTTPCTESSSCIGGSSPYNGTICSSKSSYQKDVAAMLGSNPYVVVEKYSPGASCGAATLSSIGTYIADTKCHRSSPTTSFRAIRKTDGSATIMTYADSGSCARGPATLAVTTKQAIGNSCTGGPTGVIDAKLYGGGATPLFLTVTAIYDSSYDGCKFPATPVQWVATPLSVDMCSPSVGCRYTGSFTNTVCSSTRTYNDDVAAAITWQSFVTVQRFIAGKGCSDSALSSVTTYLADGQCHSTSSSASFFAVLRRDGSVGIEIFTDSAYCSTESRSLRVSAAQATSNECISFGFADIKVNTRFELETRPW